MEFRRYFLSILAFFLLYSGEINAQLVEKDYQFLMSLNTGLDRKMYANEIMIDETQQYLVVNYGNKPTYIIVFDFGIWEPVATFRLPSWVEFSGAYFDYDKNDFFVKASRYSSEYYKLNLTSGEKEIRECETLPAGCPVVEPKQAEKGVYSTDKNYYIAINKKNARDVRVYQKR